MHPTPPPALFPRTYLVSRGNKRSLWCFALLMGAGFLCLAWFIGARSPMKSGTERAVFVALSIAAAVGSSVGLARSATQEVVLHADAIEVRLGGSLKRMQRVHIEKLSMTQMPGAPVIDLFASGADVRRLRFMLLFEADEAFVKWLSSLAT